MNTFRILSLAALMAATGAAQAGPFSYNYIEGAFGEIDGGGWNDDGDAIYLGGAMELDKQFGLLGSLGLIDFGPADGTVLRGGGLFHTPINKDLDFVGTLELVYSDWDVNGAGSDDDLGFAASGGVRYAVQDNFQIEGKLTVVEVDPYDDGLGLSVGARYFMNKQLSAAAGIANDAEFDGIWINLRYDLK